MTLNTTDKKYVLDAIDWLENGKASGLDQITNYHKSGKKMLRNLLPTPSLAFSSSRYRMGFFLMYGKQQVLPQFISQDLSQT